MRIIRKITVVCVVLVAIFLTTTTIFAEEVKKENGVEINATNFHEEYFRWYVKQVADDNKDGILQESEANRIKSISLGQFEGEGELKKFTHYTGDNNDCPSDLKGLEYFSSIEKVFIDLPGKIKNIDSLYKLVNLKELVLLDRVYVTPRKSNFKKIDLTKFPKLEKISFVYLTGIKKLDLSKNQNLKAVELWGMDKLQTLDVSKNKNLKRLYMKDCNTKSIKLGNLKKLNSLTIRQNDKVEKLNIKGLKNLSSLKVSTAKKLKRIISGKKQKIDDVTINKCKKLNKKDRKKLERY